MRCKKCSQKRLWTERILKGITQVIHYDDGYLVDELTTYEKGEGVAICGGCGAQYDKYNLQRGKLK